MSRARQQPAARAEAQDGQDRALAGRTGPQRPKAVSTATPPVLKPQSERDWQATVLQYAALRGWRAYHNPDSRRSTAGFPDLVLVRRPHVVFAELKSDTGRLRPEQVQWLDELRACGVMAVVWRPADWPEVERVLGGQAS